jgi:hypothetical protein
MKKRGIFVAVGILIMSLGIISKTTYAQGVKLGLRFMPTFSSFKVSTPDDETIKGEFTLGYGFGGMLGFYFSEHFGLQGELIYNSLSQKYSRAGLEGRVDLDYVNIPMLLSFNTGIHNPVNLNVVVGPQIGINVGGEVDQTGDNTYAALLSVRKSDLGLAYGLGLDFGLNSERTFRLDLGFRGVYGLIDISDNSGTTETDEYFVLRKTNFSTYAGYIGFSYIF